MSFGVGIASDKKDESKNYSFANKHGSFTANNNQSIKGSLLETKPKVTRNLNTEFQNC